MAADAGIDQNALAQSILNFWFVEHGRDDWFRRRQKFDDDCRTLFWPAFEAARDGKLEAMRETGDGALALIILLDQFSRNLFRDDPRAFEKDAYAREVAQDAIERGFDMTASEKKRAFFYMPFMHSEDLADQEYCVALFKERLPGSYNERYAKDHLEIIKRFGRFPHRNRILGRQSSPEEIAYLESGGFNP